MMEIKPADKHILGLSEQLGYQASQASESHNKSISSGPAAFNSSFEDYIAKALSVSESVDIEQIRRQMNAGEFDNPQAIRQAAQHILSRGI